MTRLVYCSGGTYDSFILAVPTGAKELTFASPASGKGIINLSDPPESFTDYREVYRMTDEVKDGYEVFKAVEDTLK